MDTCFKNNEINRSVIVHTNAQLKGRRLRMTRALTGFSRQEIYEKIGIATSTMDTWESGRVELTPKSAERVCAAFSKIGVYCSPEWLLSGNGTPPRIMDDVEKLLFAEKLNDSCNNFELTTKNNSLPIPPFIDNDIKKELSFFISIHKDAIFHILEYDFMGTRFKKGDCIAGLLLPLHDLAGKLVIAISENGKVFPCKIIRSLRDYCEISKSASKPHEDIKIVNAAEILWHRTSSRRNR